MEKAPESDADDYLAWLGTEAHPVPDLPIPSPAVRGKSARTSRAKEQADPARRKALTEARRGSAISCNTCRFRRLFSWRGGLYFKCTQGHWRISVRVGMYTHQITESIKVNSRMWVRGVPYVRHETCSRYKFTPRYLKREDFEEGGQFYLG